MSKSTSTQDDYPANAPGTLPVAGLGQTAQTLNGRIEVPGDTDRFAVRLESGATYRFQLERGTSPQLDDPFLRLYGPSGALLVEDDDGLGGKSQGAQIEFLAHSGGTYYLEALADGAGTGGYAIRAQVSREAPPTVVDDYPAHAPGRMNGLPARVEGKIDFAGDTDRFMLQLSAGEVLHFQMGGDGKGGVGAPSIRLLGADLQPLQSSVSSQSKNASVSSSYSHVVGSTGTYYLEVAAQQVQSTGSYWVSANANFAPPPQIASLTSADGSGPTARDPKLVLSFDAEVTRGQGALRFHDWAGREVYALSVVSEWVLVDGRNLVITPNFEFLLGGRYSVTLERGAVMSFERTPFQGLDTPGVFGFTVTDRDDHGALPGSATPISVGGAGVAGRIEVPGDSDLFRVQLEAGHSYRFNLDLRAEQGVERPVISLLDASGARVLTQHTGSKHGLSGLEYTAEQPGSYYLRVEASTGTGTGSYQVAALEVDRQAPKLVQIQPGSKSGPVPRNSAISLQFDEPVTAYGVLELRAEDGSLARSFYLGDREQVEIRGTEIRIDSISNLSPGRFLLVMQPGAVQDLAGNQYAGLATTAGQRLHVSAANTAPQLSQSALSLEGDEDLFLSGNVPAVADAEEDELSWSVAKAPLHGQVEVDSQGRFLYLPELNYSGTDRFELRVSDALGASSLLTVELTVREQRDQFFGDDADNQFPPYAGGDDYLGWGGNDVFTPGAGDDRIEGGAGLDTVKLLRPRAEFVLQRDGAGWQLSHVIEGRDQLLEVERLHFSDAGLALDLDGVAGLAARILGASLGSIGLQNTALAGRVLAALDRGQQTETVVQMVLADPLFLRQAGSSSHADLVRLVYLNVVGVAPNADDLGYFVSQIENGTYTPASLVSMAAQLDLTATQIDLVGLANVGLPYELVAGG